MGTVKSRKIRTYSERLHSNSTVDSAGVYHPPGFNQIFEAGGYEKVISEGHIWPPPKALTRAWPGIDVGGQFDVFRDVTTVSPAHTNGTFRSGNFSWDFTGSLIPLFTPSLPSSPSYPIGASESSILAQGTLGWNRRKPTRPLGGLGQAIAELHDLPKLPGLLKMKDAARLMHKEHRSRFSNMSRHKGGVGNYLGSEYLNWAFGWLPLVKDIKDLADNVKNLQPHLAQLIRDNGQPVRRKGKVNKTTSTSVLTRTPSTALAFPSLDSRLIEAPFTSVKTTTVSQEYWFSGRFRYYLHPKGAQWALDKIQIPSREDYQLSRILFGIDFTDLHLYYELMPWSWLVDWVVPVGQIIDNLVNDSADNLVADYAYIMAHLSQNDQEVTQGKLVGGPPFSCSYSRLTETKQRRYASPYGFGVSLTALRPAQLAILAALGLTRSH